MSRDKGGVYQISDRYEAVIAKTTTTGDQKICGLLQSANSRLRKISELVTLKLLQEIFTFGCDILKNFQTRILSIVVVCPLYIMRGTTKYFLANFRNLNAISNFSTFQLSTQV